jgi:hypothetical protein
MVKDNIGIDISSQIKNVIVKTIIKAFDKLPIKNTTLGNGLRRIHTMCIIRFIAIIIITRDIGLLQKFLKLFLILLILQILFKDCIITSIEQALLKDNISMIDTILEKFNYKTTPRNRFIANIILLIFIVSIIIGKWKFLLKI